jgi:hypothetical protein
MVWWMAQSMSEGCPFLHIMDAAVSCQDKAKAQCTGDCEWTEWRSCFGTDVIELSGCGTGREATLRAYAKAGSADAAATLNAELVTKNCQSKKSKDDCRSASVEMETLETASSSPGSSGRVAVLIAFVAGAFAWR